MAEWWEADPIATPGQPAEWWKADPVVGAPSADPREQGKADVLAGKNPDYRPQTSRFQRLSDQVMDPFGVQDEIVGGGQFVRKLVTSGFSLDEAKQAYSEAAERVRSERGVARDENTIIPEIVGGLGTTAISRAPAAALTWMQSAGQAAQSGAGFGAVTGFAQGEGGVENRLLNAGAAGAIGAVAGPAISNVLLPAAMRTGGAIADGVRYGGRAIDNAMHPEQAAVNSVADRITQAGTTPAAIRANIDPNQPTPRNIIDMAREVAGEGQAAPVIRLGRAANSIAGDENGAAAQALLSRQETQAGRVNNIIEQGVGGGDFEASRAAGLQHLQGEARTAYRQFYAEPPMDPVNLGDLIEDPLFRRSVAQAQRQARVETIRTNQAGARTGQPPAPVPRVNEEATSFTPQTLDYIQRQLRIASEGFASNPNNARHARNLREVFLDRIEDNYPTFRGIRRDYATGMGEFGEEGALEAGASLTKSLGAPSREALRGFDGYTPAQQELFRLGFARKLMDDATNKQTGAAVANQFDSPAVREIIQRLYPQADPALHQQGQTLVRNLRRESATTRTKNDVLAGSRTAELGGDMGNILAGGKAAADVLTGRWGKVLENLSTRLTTQIGRRGSAEVLRLLTETDPAQLIPILDRLARAATTTQQRQAYVTAIRQVRAQQAPRIGAVAGQGSGSTSKKKDRQ